MNILAESGEEHLAVATATFASIENYEVVCKEWKAFSPEQIEDREAIPCGEIRTDFRMLLNRKSEECLFVKRTSYDLDESSVKQKGVIKMNPVIWTLENFRNGIATSKLPSKGEVSSRKMTFDEFFEKRQVPAVELSGLGYPVNLHEGINAVLEGKLKKARESSLKRMPDGSIWMYWHMSKNDYTEKMVFDRRTLMPTEFSSSALFKGKRVIPEKQVTTYEEIDGIFRPTRITFERLEWQTRRDTKKAVNMDIIGTLEIEWLKFNEPSVVFPNEETLGTDPILWAKFLGIIDR
ncbi:MAG: hypothetical protein SGI77_18100 [Pirellulaceae bacterium]|nr:hypothetical protein [Pirellulaceae bacterium]